MRDFTKSEKRIIRKFVDMAYEIELSKELIALQKKFDAWKLNKISCFELNDEIHEYRPLR